MILSVIFLGVVIVLAFASYTCFQSSKCKTLEGKHVVVTGGSSGIGKAVAIQAAALGAHVTVISRNVSSLMNAVSEVNKHCKDRQKQKIQYLSLDVTADYETIKKELVRIEENVGPVYMLVNSAGMAKCGRLEDMPADDVKHMMDLNYFGTAYPTKALLGCMKSRGDGIIVLVSSQAALTGIYGLGPYGAAKWAVRGLGESLVMESYGTGVSITVCYPPDTDTPGFAVEEQTKPIETKLISQSAGLVSPENVAHQLINDALLGKPHSVYGFEGRMLSTLCLMSWSGILSALIQATLLGPVRLVFAAYQIQFRCIVLRCRHKKDTDKKAE